MQFHTIFLKLSVISPVHIGCGEVYEPTSFFINKEKNLLIHFDITHLLRLLSPKEINRFKEICRKGTTSSIIELMKFIYNRANDSNIEGHEIPVSKEIVKRYHNLLTNRYNQEINQFKIERTVFDSLKGYIYIPGSTIKGAIRTAILNYRYKNHKCNNSKIKEKDILEYSDFYNDPFRLLKVSDFYPIHKPRQQICYAINKKRDPKKHSKTSRLPNIIETIEPTTEFIGTISLYSYSPINTNNIKQPLTIDEIYKALKYFYHNEKHREEKEIVYLRNSHTKLNYNLNNKYLLRIGRYCGAQNITIDKCRQIDKSSKKSKKHPTTIWLRAHSKKSINNLQTFGWVIMEPISKEEWNKLNEQSDKMLEDIYLSTKNNIQHTNIIIKNTKSKSPEEMQKDLFESFKEKLPKASELPGQINTILQKIESFEDAELKRMCTEYINKQFNSQIKKARRKNKTWAISFQEFYNKIINS